MTTRSLYAIACVAAAKQSGVVSYGVAVIAASSEAEAEGLGLRECRRAFSVEDGFVNHGVSCARIEDETLARAGWVRP